jgi:hypothetical protein
LYHALLLRCSSLYFVLAICCISCRFHHTSLRPSTVSQFGSTWSRALKLWKITMRYRSKHNDSGARLSLRRSYAVLVLLVALHVHSATAIVYPSTHELYKFDYLSSNHGSQRHSRRSLTKRDNPIPLVITNSCDETIWPGIATQAGAGPESNGFALAPGESKNLTVGSTWQGRCWGRTNCTVSGDTATCETGDCLGLLDCQLSVSLGSYIDAIPGQIHSHSHRERPPSHSRSSTWRVAPMAINVSTISRS